MSILNELDNYIKENISPNEIYSHIHSIHGKQEDFEEGDINDRIYGYDTYVYDENIPMEDVDLQEWDLDEDYVEDIIEEIKKNNDYEPIVVGETDVSYYTIIDGLHRLNALNELGYKTFKGYIGKNK